MAAVRRLHGQALKIQKAAARTFKKQLFTEFSRLGGRWIPLAKRFIDDPQALDSATQDLLAPHAEKIKEIIRKNNVRVMRAIHTFQADLLGVKRDDPLYARTRGMISSLSSSLAKTASGEIINTTQKVLERGVDMVAMSAEADDGIAYVRERLKGGIAQRRSVNISEDQSHKAGNAIIEAFGSVAQKTGEVMWKMWMSRRDGKVRHTHAVADGQTVRANETYSVGDSELQFPGDPSGSAAEVINCRCYQIMKRRKGKRAA